MAEVTDVQTRVPYVEALTVKFARNEVFELLQAFEGAWHRNNYTYNLKGGMPEVYNTLFSSLYNYDPPVFKPKKKLPEGFYTFAFDAASPL